MGVDTEALADRLTKKVEAATAGLNDDEYIEVVESVSEKLDAMATTKREERGDFDDNDGCDEIGWDEG